MKEFFGFGGYQRPAEGFLSWQHLLFVTLVLAVMTALAVHFGKKNRNTSEEKQRKVLMVAAILIDAAELFKLVLVCIRSSNPWSWLYDLPLFLCSIQLITLPLAAFSKGRLREVATDFVFIFGLLGAVMGTYGAGNNYGSYPVLSFDNVISAITHAIAGFGTLYIGITGMMTMKKKNFPLTFSIMLGFCVTAYAANHILSYNYMFLMRGDGTPYDILYNLVNGSPFLYPLGVVLLFFLYILAFYYTYYGIQHLRTVQKDKKAHAMA